MQAIAITPPATATRRITAATAQILGAGRTFEPVIGLAYADGERAVLGFKIKESEVTTYFAGSLYAEGQQDPRLQGMANECREFLEAKFQQRYAPTDTLAADLQAIAARNLLV